MPPKRSKRIQGSTPKRHRRTSTAGNTTDIPVSGSSPHSPNTAYITSTPTSPDSQPSIDYDKLAAAILKQTSTSVPNVEPSPVTPLPSTSTAACHSLPVNQSTTAAQITTTSTVAAQIPGSSTPSTATNIGAIVDQVFLGSLQNSSTFESSTDTSSKRPVEHLSQTCRKLLAAALSTSSVAAYRRSWDLLLSWKTHITFPVSVIDTCNFIGYLFTSNYSSSSIASHISAISYVHKVMNVVDPTQAFVTRKILKGCQSLGPTKDTRLPITANILQQLLNALEHTVNQYSIRILLRALFLLAFHAFLRLGEVTAKSVKSGQHLLQRPDISFEYKGTSLSGVQIIMRDYKTNKHHNPLVISLQSIPDSAYCPVQALFTYLQFFNHKTGPLFQTMDGLPVSYSKVTSYLKTAIQFTGLDPTNFKGHSFRIGAATHAASLGYSENMIQKLGRWNSDAFRRYIRIDSFQI